MAHPPDRRVIVGRVTGVFGVRGWIKVYSYTRPKEAILNYTPWLLERQGESKVFPVAEGRAQGKGVVARLEGCTDRDAVAALIGSEITVPISQLPAPREHEYYWAELEGLRVVNLAGRELGRVSHLFETGANDVIAVQGERERLIPVGPGIVRRVDRTAGVIYVDWEAED